MPRLAATLCTTFLIVCAVIAQPSRHLTPALLSELERSCPRDGEWKSAHNVLAQVDGNKISQDWEKTIGVDQHFSLRLKDRKITDQKGTGRCWMFSGLNVIRPIVARNLHIPDIELSQAYLFFYEKLEKSNLFLDAVIETRALPPTDRKVETLFRQMVQDGQNWMGFIELVEKYGVVPKEIMPETYSSSNSGHVNQVLSLRLKRAAMMIRHETSPEQIAALRLQALKDVYKILAVNFGFPPSAFSWRYATEEKGLRATRDMSPQEFAREFVGESLKEYYPFYSIPTLPFNKKFEIDRNRTVSDKPNLTFVNIPLETMKDLARQSLLDSSAVWFGCDVGQQSNSEGLMAAGLYDYRSLYGMEFGLSRKELFETYSTIPTHNMVFTGIDIVDGKVRKWLVENSWGEARGKKGYFTMLDDWFDDYVQEVVVHRKYISKETLALFETASTVLPPWDPMLRSLLGE